MARKIIAYFALSASNYPSKTPRSSFESRIYTLKWTQQIKKKKNKFLINHEDYKKSLKWGKLQGQLPAEEKFP